MHSSSVILSIDVGIKHLSFCVLNISSDQRIEIKQWDNVCITNGNTTKLPIGDLTESLLNSLNSHFDSDFKADYVIIENQPMLKNGLMKTMSVIIYTYFNMLKMLHGSINDIRFVSATNKLKCKGMHAIEDTLLPNKTYQNRKHNSVLLARLHITKLSPHKLEWFEGQRKKDDYADSLNQAIAFIEKTFKIDC